MKKKMLPGPATRTRAMQKLYTAYLKSRAQNEQCIFCHIPDEQPETILEEHRKMLVVKNRFGYSVWEGCKVTEHLMIIPKSHRHSLSDFTKEEKAEWADICARFEANGYSLYTRSPGNITKSIPHHHTHFIKLKNKRISLMFYVRKPHILIAR